MLRIQYIHFMYLPGRRYLFLSMVIRIRMRKLVYTPRGGDELGKVISGASMLMVGLVGGCGVLVQR